MLPDALPKPSQKQSTSVPRWMSFGSQLALVIPSPRPLQRGARCPSCLTCSWDEGPLTYGFPTGRPGFIRHSTSSHPQPPASDSVCLLILLLSSTATQAALPTGHLFLVSRPKSFLGLCSRKLTSSYWEPQGHDLWPNSPKKNSCLAPVWKNAFRSH